MKLFIALSALLALVATLPAFAQAAPPANDNRAAAEPIPAFPAAVHGTNVEATVERLDPQVSQCGRVESTVWYRIDQAPDGTIALAIQGAGFAPVIRVYAQRRSSIQELDCASGAAGAGASVAFAATRGNTYLVLVGKRPGTADAPFDLQAKLFLPPENDTRRGATRIAKLPGTVAGTTLGATAADDDPEGCGLAAGTVWYALAARADGRVLLRVHAEGELDAAVVVLERVRSQSERAGCSATDRKGAAVVAFAVRRGATYLVAVGQRRGSGPGTFTLQALASQAAERGPGTALPAGGARSSVNGLTDVNDVWWKQLTAGTTYRIAFSSSGCPYLMLRGPHGRLRSFECNGYASFTPGPDGGGRYVLEVAATGSDRTQPYSLRVAASEPDDIGVGVELANLSTMRGSLAPEGVDLVDLYHFDVAAPSDVRLRLGNPAGRSFSMLLLTDGGRRIEAAAGQIRRRLTRGRYVLAVRGQAGSAGGRYAVSLVVRGVTVTTLTGSPEVVPGSAVALAVRTTPAPDGGTIVIQIDRFDPLAGWQFSRLLRVAAPSASISWTPPAPGRWRARARLLGTLRASPSRSGYAYVLVAKPIG
jgi:hypothetical protein